MGKKKLFAFVAVVLAAVIMVFTFTACCLLYIGQNPVKPNWMKIQEKLENAGYYVIAADSISGEESPGIVKVLSAVKQTQPAYSRNSADSPVEGITVVVFARSIEANEYYLQNEYNINYYGKMFKNGKVGVQDDAVYFGSPDAVRAVWPNITFQEDKYADVISDVVKIREKLEKAGYRVDVIYADLPSGKRLSAIAKIYAVKSENVISADGIFDFFDGIEIIFFSQTDEALAYYDQNKDNLKTAAGFFNNGMSGIQDKAIYIGSLDAVNIIRMHLLFNFYDIKEKLTDAGYIVCIEELQEISTTFAWNEPAILLHAVKKSADMPDDMSAEDLSEIIGAGGGDRDGIDIFIFPAEAVDIINSLDDNFGSILLENFKDGEHGKQLNVIYAGSSDAVKVIWPDKTRKQNETEDEVALFGVYEFYEAFNAAGYAVAADNFYDNGSLEFIGEVLAVKKYNGILTNYARELLDEVTGSGELCCGVIIYVFPGENEAEAYYDANYEVLALKNEKRFQDCTGGFYGNVVYFGSADAVNVLLPELRKAA
jgi:hypothetical protein